jgi:hypothetical protein
VNKLAAVFALVLTSSFTIAQTAPAVVPPIAGSSTRTVAVSTVPSCPTVTGAYYLQANVWVPMDLVHSVGFKTTNVTGAAFSYGLAKMRYKAQFRDKASPYQLKGNTLEVCLIGVTDSARDLTLAKLQEEKDRRELPMASVRAWTGVNAQMDSKVIVPITSEKIGDKAYLVKSDGPLPNGEFILFVTVPDVAAMVKSNASVSLGGYDFGCHAKN